MNSIFVKITAGVFCFFLFACVGQRNLKTKSVSNDDEFYSKPTVRFTEVSPGDTIKIIVYNEKDFSYKKLNLFLDNIKQLKDIQNVSRHQKIFLDKDFH